MNTEDLIALADSMLGKRFSLLSLWQEQADNFYPERADFTYKRSLGTEFAEHLMTSYPMMVRRDLANQFSTMLRPKQKEWFHMKTRDEDRKKDVAARQWLEMATAIQRKAMYDRDSLFVRAAREGDHDFATFGQCVITVNLNRDRSRLLYRCWHLRDVAWKENSEGKIDTVCRKWNPTALVLQQTFGDDSLHDEVKKCLEKAKDKYKTVNVRHILLPTDVYAEGKFRQQYTSIYIDIDNKHIIEEVGVNHFEYVIPRWQTVSGSPYAFSPATVCALPDARLMQQMWLVLLEAGEKATNPPLIATEEMVRGGIQTFAGGVTWVDAEYDERLGDVLRPISQDYRGMPIGIELNDRVAASLMEAFYINKLSLPPAQTKEMTAYETAQRVEQYVREALPLFEPMEMEWNGQVCERTFDVLLANGGFGSMMDMPRSLIDADVEFRFESPLHDSIERIKGQRFLETKQYIMEGMEVDPDIAAEVDIRQAFRDAINGIGAPAEWLREKEHADIIREGAEEQRQAVAMAAFGKNAAETAKLASDAGGAGGQ